MALIVCPNPNCRRSGVSDSGRCPICNIDIPSELRKIEEQKKAQYSEFTCPECKNTYEVETVSGKNYHTGVNKAGYCLVCGYNIFSYIEQHTCTRCGLLSEYSLKRIRIPAGLSYGPYCTSCYYARHRELFPPPLDPMKDGNAGPWDLHPD